MPPLSMKAARALESSFKGRITSSHDAHAEFQGAPPVLIPESVDDVGRALRLARAADRRVFVRSGRSISATDTSTSAVAALEPAPAILSMEAFRAVDIDDRRVTVGAAATTADVAATLSDPGLFLPLDDNPTQSIASAVLSMDASPFVRSGAGGGSLRSAVVEAEVVPTDGAGAGRVTTVRKKALADLLAGKRAAVITKLVFDTAAATSNEADRWMQAWMTSYERKSFAALCNALFGAGADPVPAGVDLSVRVTSAAYSMMLVIVRVTGHGDADGTAAADVVTAALAGAQLPVLGSDRATGPGASVAAWVATGPGSAAPGEVLRRFGSNIAPRPFVKVRQKLFNAVDFAIGVSSSTGLKRAPGVHAWAELQLAPTGGVFARAEISDADATPKVAQEARVRMATAIPADKVSPAAAVARRALVRRAPARRALRGVEVMSARAPTPGFAITSSNVVRVIPGFDGDVFAKADATKSYRDAIAQYAASPSSYPPAVVAARMTPRYVARPTSSSDVVTAVTFASQQGLKVVTRSGGHQYCGLSSGGDATLLLDMTRFVQVDFTVPAGAKTPTQVTVGPGVELRVLSTALRKNRVTVPHGECPLVRLGGHVQTGGIGHQLRSLGATVDWVRSFKMVTRDPQTSGVDAYVERTFTRPHPGGGNGAANDADVFRAVLGGGPSSWGVLTEITFDLVPDKHHAAAEGYTRTYPYDLGKRGFRAAMQQLQQWAQRQAAGTLPPGIDLFLTVVSGVFDFRLLKPKLNVRPAALIVETMSREKAGVKEVKAVVDAVQLAMGLIPPVSSSSGRRDLSLIADDGVRAIGVLGLPASGREFDLPYKKSLYITMTPFSQTFCDRFVGLVDAAHGHDGLKVVVQVVVGGGDFSANGHAQTTHMQRRAGLVQLVFDVFYEPGREAAAEGFQAQMKALLSGFSGGKDVRMVWGTFEDANTSGKQLDMSRRDVQDFYYDSPAEYARLQEIKAYTDPGDIFHTSFTVQLP